LNFGKIFVNFETNRRTGERTDGGMKWRVFTSGF